MKVNYSGEFTVRMKPSYDQYNLMNSQEQMMVYKEMEAKGWLNYADVSRKKNGGVYRQIRIGLTFFSVILYSKYIL